MVENKSLHGVISLLIISSVISSALSQVTPAPVCDVTACKLPSCRCGQLGAIPGGLTKDQTPQFVFLTFDDALHDNFNFYKDTFFGRKNPNNESITATFFVTHDYSIYPNIHELWRNGHEIGLHSISGNYSQEYWRSLNASMWAKELVDQREQMSTFARIPVADIKGVRTPQVEIGDGDTVYGVLNQANITYDASRPSNLARQQGLWPYTNDYKSEQDCWFQSTCPKGQYNGLWTVPMINWEPNYSPGDVYCFMADQCSPVPTTQEDTYNLLRRNFESHYTDHRSPFGIFTRHGWVNGSAESEDKEIILQRQLGYTRFLDHLSTLDDVYIVSISRVIEWVQNPTPLSEVASFSAFKVEEKPSQCPKTHRCNYRKGETPFKPPYAQERLMQSCAACPIAYPWVGNHLGRQQYT